MRWLILSLVMGVLHFRPAVADEKPSPPPPPAPGVDEAPVRRTAARVATVTTPQVRGVEFEVALIHLESSWADGSIEVPSSGKECLAAIDAWRDAGVLAEKTAATVQSMPEQVARIHIGQTVKVPVGVQTVMSRDRSSRTVPRFGFENVGLIVVCTATAGEGDRLLVEVSVEETRFTKSPVDTDVADAGTGQAPTDKESTVVKTTVLAKDGECQVIGRFQTAEQDGASRVVLVLLTPRWLNSAASESQSQ